MASSQSIVTITSFLRSSLLFSSLFSTIFLRLLASSMTFSGKVRLI